MSYLFVTIVAMTLALTSAMHYAPPPCQTDEVELEVTDPKSKYSGKVCAPACGDDGKSCPMDKPPTAATPQCLLHDSGKKYCALGCFLGCGNPEMTCLSLGAPSFRKVCAYRKASELESKDQLMSVAVAEPEPEPEQEQPSAHPHYAMPPCLSDEVELEVTDPKSKYSGKVCAPACGDDGKTCPMDKPPTAATPQCLLHDSGKKYCALGCFLGCGNPEMTCLNLGAPSFRKVCAYRKAVELEAENQFISVAEGVEFV